jgi:type I restriction enzyme M protein
MNSARPLVQRRSLEDSANLADPDVIAQEIVEDLEAAVSQFAGIAADLKQRSEWP